MGPGRPRSEDGFDDPASSALAAIADIIREQTAASNKILESQLTMLAAMGKQQDSSSGLLSKSLETLSTQLGSHITAAQTHQQQLAAIQQQVTSIDSILNRETPGQPSVLTRLRFLEEERGATTTSAQISRRGLWGMGTVVVGAIVAAVLSIISTLIAPSGGRPHP
jgi:hypothetical protein